MNLWVRFAILLIIKRICRRPSSVLIYDFAPDPFWISLNRRKNFFSFLTGWKQLPWILYSIFVCLLGADIGALLNIFLLFSCVLFWNDKITLFFKKIYFFSQCDLISARAVHQTTCEGCGDAAIKSPDHVADIPESDHAAECVLFRQSDIRPTGALEAGRPHLLYSVVAVVRVLLLKGKVLL